MLILFSTCHRYLFLKLINTRKTVWQLDRTFFIRYVFTRNINWFWEKMKSAMKYISQILKFWQRRHQIHGTWRSQGENSCLKGISIFFYTNGKYIFVINGYNCPLILCLMLNSATIITQFLKNITCVNKMSFISIYKSG